MTSQPVGPGVIELSRSAGHSSSGYDPPGRAQESASDERVVLARYPRISGILTSSLVVRSSARYLRFDRLAIFFLGG